MPKQSKRKLACRNNVNKRINHVYMPNEKVSGFSNNSLILEENNFKRSPIKKVFFDEVSQVEKFKKKPIVSPKKKPTNVTFDNKLENQYHAVLDYETERVLKKKVSSQRSQQIVDKFKVGSVRTLRRIASRARNHQSLKRRIGSGRPASVSNRLDIISFIEKKARELDYEFNQRAMTVAVQQEFGVGSKSTIERILFQNNWKTSKAYIKPALEEAHKLARFGWSTQRLRFDFFSEKKVVVHIDEKHFYAFKDSRIVHYPPHVDPPIMRALSKTQIPKVMFLGAVAPPNKARNFDGKIGLWMVSEKKEAKKSSKFHDRGDVYDTPAIMNGKLFVDMCRTKLIPAINRKLSWAESIEVQMDSAGGHKISTSVDELNEYCKKKFPNISFVTQPTRSPDLNVLDLGIWNSLQSLVPSVKYEENSKVQMSTRIVKEVERSWEDYDSYSKLSKIFNTLTMIYEEVIRANGDNNFKLPHSRNRVSKI